jgi:hypothetical protein
MVTKFEAEGFIVTLEGGCSGGTTTVTFSWLHVVDPAVAATLTPEQAVRLAVAQAATPVSHVVPLAKAPVSQ